jgi:Ras-related protein Rab-8A
VTTESSCTNYSYTNNYTDHLSDDGSESSIFTDGPVNMNHNISLYSNNNTTSLSNSSNLKSIADEFEDLYDNNSLNQTIDKTSQINHNIHSPSPCTPKTIQRQTIFQTKQSNQSDTESELSSSSNKRVVVRRKRNSSKLQQQSQLKIHLKPPQILKEDTNINNCINIQETQLSIISSTPERMYKIVFAGDSAVGKTSFITRYCKGKFNDSTSATLGVDYFIKLIDLNGQSIALQLWDTCGQERFRSIAKSYFRKADAVVLMYDCICEQSFINVRDWITIINDATNKQIPIILLGNKSDLRDEAENNCLKYEDGQQLSKVNNFKFIFIIVFSIFFLLY